MGFPGKGVGIAAGAPPRAYTERMSSSTFTATAPTASPNNLVVRNRVERFRTPAAAEIRNIIPENDLIRSIQPGTDLDNSCRHESVIEKLFFPTPCDLDGFSNEPRQANGFGNLQAASFTAKSAADKRRYYPHVFGRNTQNAGHLWLNHKWRLR